MELTLDDNLIKDQVRQAVMDMNLIPEDDLKGRTWSIDEFRKACCINKSALWVRTYIFDEFPEVDYKNGGWCLGAHKGDGVKKTIIFAYEATRWMEKNKRRIDWKARVM